MRPFISLALLVSSLLVVPAAVAQSHRGQVECSSRDFHMTRCDAPWRDAQLVRQSSDSRCAKGSTWGIDRQGLWVDKGCSGVFEEVGRGNDYSQTGHGNDYGRDNRDGRDGRDNDRGHNEWRPGPNWDQDISFRCASQDFDYHFCQVDVGRGGRIYVQRQVSKATCIEGQSWGYNRAGVWVNGGCEAQFVIERRWR